MNKAGAVARFNRVTLGEVDSEPRSDPQLSGWHDLDGSEQLREIHPVRYDRCTGKGATHAEHLLGDPQ